MSRNVGAPVTRADRPRNRHSDLARCRWPIALGLVLLAAPAVHASETVSCTDANDEIAFSYGIDPHAPQPILWVEMQLTGDFGLVTDPSHPKFDGDYISTGYTAHGMEGGDVAWRDDQGREHAAMSFRIGRVYEAQQGHVAGAVSVDGGGLWTVTCSSEEPDEEDVPLEEPAKRSFMCRSVRTNQPVGRLESEEAGLLWFDADADAGEPGSRLTTRSSSGQLYVTGGRLFERYGQVWTELEPFTRESAGTFAFHHATGPVLVCIASSSSGVAD